MARFRKKTFAKISIPVLLMLSPTTHQMKTGCAVAFLLDMICNCCNVLIVRMYNSEYVAKIRKKESFGQSFLLCHSVTAALKRPITVVTKERIDKSPPLISSSLWWDSFQRIEKAHRQRKLGGIFQNGNRQAPRAFHFVYRKIGMLPWVVSGTSAQFG